MYIYIKSEPKLFTVGFYDSLGIFQPESDHDSKEKAASRVSYLNGNKSSSEKSMKILDMIILDCETDVKVFEGKELNGKTVGELHGILEAKIQAIAKIVKKSME